MGISHLFKFVVGSSVPVSGVSFFGGGIIDGIFGRELKILVNDSGSDSKDYVHFFKGLGSGSDKSSGLFIKTKLKAEKGVGTSLKGGLGIKLGSGYTSGESDEQKPWVLIGSAENGMFYIPGWRVTDQNGKVSKRTNIKYPTWRSWFLNTKFTKNEDNVGPDVWCPSFFDVYKGFLTGPLKIVIQQGKPIFLGNLENDQNKIYANRKSGTSSIDFKKAHCSHSQGFAWLGPEAVIVGNFANDKNDDKAHVGRTFKGLKGWNDAQGVSLGNMKGFILDRIDRFSISEQGISDSRGNEIKWESEYNPTIKISYS